MYISAHMHLRRRRCARFIALSHLPTLLCPALPPARLLPPAAASTHRGELQGSQPGAPCLLTALINAGVPPFLANLPCSRLDGLERLIG
jgi:hypothetical protein